MPGPLKTFDPDNMLIAFAGIPISGYAKGSFITLAQNTESFVTLTGVDGETIRIKVGDNSFTVTVKLLQSSDSNAVLSAIHLSDLEAANGAGVGIFAMSDLSGTTVLASAESFIMGYPESDFDDAGTTREWKFFCNNPTVVVGGN
jgi:hypothetical protein